MSDAAAARVAARQTLEKEKSVKLEKTVRTVVDKLELAEQRRLSTAQKHSEACGNQASSLKNTSPKWSIGFHATQVYNTDLHRIPIDHTDRRTMEEHLKPGPGHFEAPPISPTPTSVLAGWEITERFPHSRSAVRSFDGYMRTERLEKAHQLWADAVLEERSPMSSPQKGAAHAACAQPAPALLSQGTSESVEAAAVQPASEQVEPKRPSKQPRKQQSLGFGTSGLGFRFKHGTQFSKDAPFHTHGRVAGYARLRNAVTDQELLERAKDAGGLAKGEA